MAEVGQKSLIFHSSLSECCGALEYYDKAFDRITTRSEKPLRSIKRIFHTVTTTDDPVIRKVCTLGPLLGMLPRPQKEQGMRCAGVPQYSQSLIQDHRMDTKSHGCSSTGDVT